MTTGPYKIIFTLLIASVVCVLALQGFWIRNFYFQKKDDFNKTVYAALEQVNNKLRDRQNLRAVRDQVTIHRKEITSEKGTSVVSTTSYAQVLNTKKPSVEVSITRMDTLKGRMTNVSVSDSVLKIKPGGMTIVSNKPADLMKAGNPDLDKMMDKMLMEIKIIDTDERNPDTLCNIIRRVLANKGIFTPFEFALKKIFKNKDETLAKSAHFNDQIESFTTDLSANNIFSTHNYLMLQFPDRGDFMFAAMKNMLLLSLLFSLIIIGVFYYVLRLILSQKKLSEVKNDFVNNMTHELKTPIATISLAIDSMADPQVKHNEARFNDYTRILKEENKKLNDHVERVLQMAQLDKGELQLHKKECDLLQIAKEVVASYQLQIIRQQAAVTIESAAQEALLNADAFHLQKVFSNLLDNALKYSAENCTVLISITETPTEVILSFKDNGIGIDASMKEKIFDRFYRVQGGNLHDAKGFGLGLSYARSIIEAHAGSIAMNSRKGEGSEFIIHLKKHGR